ncbi:hypothetical protein MYX07_06720 [Patescibacteria group bacterium AH-259-L07]|nr:hypothetical protein [Patescibacteria group bacterium AH-259-L07]
MTYPQECDCLFFRYATLKKEWFFSLNKKEVLRMGTVIIVLLVLGLCGVCGDVTMSDENIEFFIALVVFGPFVLASVLSGFARCMDFIIHFNDTDLQKMKWRRERRQLWLYGHLIFPDPLPPSACQRINSGKITED